MQPVHAPQQPTRGRGLLIAGAVMMTIAVVGGGVLVSIFGRQIDLNDLNRDVVIEGSADRLVPGTLEFKVLEPLGGSSGSGEMSVGVAIPSGASPEPECTITGSDSASVLSSSARTDDVLLSSGNTRTDTVLVVARLEPGTYTAECTMPGEPSAASGVSFTVGRVLRPQEVLEDFGALFGAAAVVVVAGLIFVVGLVLAIIGLILRSRARRVPPQPPYPGFPYPPGQHPQQYPGQQYPGQPQPPYPQPGYPQPEYQPQQPQYQPPQPQYQPPEPWTPPPTEVPQGPSDDDGSSGWTVPPSKR